MILNSDRRERDIIERNEQLALRAALADLARWNSTWQEGRRESQQKRREISAELAIVNKLLLSTQAKKKSGGRRRRRRRRAAAEGVVVTSDGLAAVHSRPRGLFPAVVVVGFVASLCVRGFDNYVESHSTESLAKVSFASVGLIVMGIYSHALYKLAEEERHRLK